MISKDFAIHILCGAAREVNKDPTSEDARKEFLEIRDVIKEEGFKVKGSFTKYGIRNLTIDGEDITDGI